jgi:uncharacterized protein (TIGR03435 family)
MLVLMGSRNVTMDVLAGALSSLFSSGLGRRVIDKMGLQGRFDFTLESAREPRGPAPSHSPVPAAPAGPTPIEALRDQLGIKLELAKGSLPVLLIDNVDRPSEK